MKISVRFALVLLALMGTIGCGKASTPTAILANTPVLPTNTPLPTSPTPTSSPTIVPPTATTIPSPTPLPGTMVLPVDSLDNKIPWLPLEHSRRPGTYFFYFNLSKPPFDNVLVRKAFVAAIDREALVDIANKYGANNPSPATSFTPPETLGRDLYDEIGIPFDPGEAKKLLTQAGYTDPGKFPPVTVLINVGGRAAPGFHVKIANEMARMWQEYLGVTVTVEVVGWETFLKRIDEDPPDIFRITWVADYNDPDNFLRELFASDAQYNYGHFSNTEFDRLVDIAAKNTNAAERQNLYIQAERILCETEVAIIPIYHATYNIP